MPSMIALIALLFVFTSVATCQPNTPASQRSTDGQDIREAVIRKQMEDWIKSSDRNEAEAKDNEEKAIAKKLNFRIFFVSLDGEDPSDEFLAKFKDVPRIVKKVSDSEIGKVQRMPVVDKSSGERGIIFSADKVHWRSKDSAEVEGGYHCDGLCGAGLRFRVKRENGKWIVKSSKMDWIS
ncbi:MAG TPA: hypothetical protein VK828_22350 [Terriglobales bacterium]|nr:hypothetical protein [Terriglobales bacterium]